MLPEYEGFDPEEVDRLIEADLSSDEEVLNRIDPGNKRKYNLSINEVLDPEIGNFECSEAVRLDESIKVEPAFFSRDNTKAEKHELIYLTKEINPALKDIIPYVMSKHSQ